MAWELEYPRPLFAEEGPWASVDLDVTRAEENADRRVEPRGGGRRPSS